MNVQDVENYLQSAAGDVGYAAADSLKQGWAEDAVVKSYNNFIGQGGDPQYFGEVYSDQVYNDPGFQKDMIGDYIYSEPNRDELLDGLEQQYPVAVATLRDQRAK